MTESLHILYGDTAVGVLGYVREKDAITLEYEDSWRSSADGFPVSLSLSMAKKIHADLAIRPFLQGLLPDNAAVLEAWGKQFHVSPRNPFDLIKHVGEDCAGALQFVRPERLERILSGELDTLIPLAGGDLEKRLVDIQSQYRAIPTAIEGRFSLAGAQTKDALHRKNGRWFVPGGRIPTTHILKPQPEGFVELALNEHFCLQLAAQIGLMRASSEILKIAGLKVLCVERYDRIMDNGTLVRIHQEDTCQALGKGPGQKYQNEGGPSAAGIVNLLDRYSDDRIEDILGLVMALAFNWVIAGTDAHSKNYSLLHGKGSVLRLAPFYDLISHLPYQSDPKSSHVRLAMKIGGTYTLRRIGAKQWHKWLEEAGLSPMWLESVVRLVVERISENLDVTKNEIAKENDCPFLHLLANKIHVRALECLKELK